MNLRQRKCGQSVKDQGEDVHATHRPVLKGQTPSKPGTHLCFYHGPLEAGPEPHPEDADGSVTPAEGSWQGNATPPGTHPQTFALIKIDFGTSYFVPLNRLLRRLYVRSAEHKDSYIIGVRRDLRSDTVSKKGSAQGQICRSIPKRTEQGLQSKDIEKR